jgi:excisionase family DNA binding protein
MTRDEATKLARYLMEQCCIEGMRNAGGRFTRVWPPEKLEKRIASVILLNCLAGIPAPEVSEIRANEVTVAQAARALGVARMYVYELLASGRIKGRKVLGRWLLSRRAIEAYRREHPRAEHGAAARLRS